MMTMTPAQLWVIAASLAASAWAAWILAGAVARAVTRCWRKAVATPGRAASRPHLPGPDEPGNSALAARDLHYLDYLAEQTEGLPREHRRCGQELADILRRSAGEVRDVQLAAVLLPVLSYTGTTIHECQEQGVCCDDAMETVIAVLSCAALDLTAVERATAP